MSLDGLRAWIGEVERKLGVRTKVMLALAAIAIAGAGAGIYLAIDTRQNAVSEGDVQELQTQLETGVGGGDGAAEIETLRSEVAALQAEVDALQTAGGSGGAGSGAKGGGSATPGADARPELPDITP